MNCPECGQETRRNFCTKCGARLDAFGEHIESDHEHIRDGSDPNATTVINHRELREMLARVSQVEEAKRGGVAVDPAQTIPKLMRPFAKPSNAAVMPVPAAPPVSQAVTVNAQNKDSPGTGVRLTIDVPESSRRLWAVPVFGYVAKALMLVPHMLVLTALSLVVGCMHLAAWVPVLRNGAYPPWAARWTTATIRWQARVWAYSLGLVDQYPPFDLDDTLGYPVRVIVTLPETSSRFWAIPVLGYMAKLVILVPHMLVLYALCIAVTALQLVAWAFVLATGEMPGWARRYATDTIRYQVRVSAYLFGLTDTYPPFSLG